jgi:hypothetical protein
MKHTSSDKQCALKLTWLRSYVGPDCWEAVHPNKASHGLLMSTWHAMQLHNKQTSLLLSQQMRHCCTDTTIIKGSSLLLLSRHDRVSLSCLSRHTCAPSPESWARLRAATSDIASERQSETKSKTPSRFDVPTRRIVARSFLCPWSLQPGPCSRLAKQKQGDYAGQNVSNALAMLQRSRNHHSTHTGIHQRVLISRVH